MKKITHAPTSKRKKSMYTFSTEIHSQSMYKSMLEALMAGYNENIEFELRIIPNFND